MEFISETKIREAIEQCLRKGDNRFIIYPYGKKGKLVKHILNEEYGIEELALVDNYLSVAEENIYSAEEAYKIFNDYTILFSAEKKQVRAELEKTVLCTNNKKITDIAQIPMLGCNQFSFKEKKVLIDSCNQEQLENVFARTHEIWTQLGEEESYWSVLTDDKFLSENIGEKEIREFYETGRENVKQIAATLIRNGMVDKETELENYDITEIGCGCGRVTKGLADLFHQVTAVDISKGNLAVAKNTISKDNVIFQMISQVDEYGKLPKADVVYSYLVLQHNCPPVIEYIIDAMLKMLKPQGIAMFQVPTYEWGYRFCYDEYMESEKKGIEMHVIPQQKVFEIAYENHCMPLEVYQDNSTGKNDYSSWFVIKKKGDVSEEELKTLVRR